jgi:cyclophilin family peptidyl-prolyl cis-trans isomerase
MKLKTILLITLAAASLALVNCSKKPAANKSALAEIKKGVVPVADPEVAVIEMENPVYGTIKIELYSNIAPKMVARFKELANEGFYNGITFHRINESVIQGGDPNSKDDDTKNDGSGGSKKPNVPAEFSDIKYESGILGAARLGNDVNSANCQFFITLRRVAGFDNDYTVFGKVIEGMNNVRTISGVQPKEGERPIEDVRIKSVTIQPRN